MKRITLAATAAALLALAGCSSYDAAHNHNAPRPTQDIHLKWVWIDSPGSFDTIIFACHKTVGIYETQDSSLPFRVVADDPNCAGQ